MKLRGRTLLIGSLATGAVAIATVVLAPTIVQELAVHRLRTGPEDRRLAALRRLGELRAARAVPAIAAVARSTGETPRLRRAAVRALGAIGARLDVAVPALIETQRQTEGSTIPIANDLGEIAAAPVSPDDVADAVDEVQYRLGKRAVPALLQILDGGNRLLRVDAVRWLESWDLVDVGVASRLATLRGDPFAELRQAVADALGDGADPGIAVPALIALLGDSEDAVVAAAAASLGEHDAAASGAVRALTALLDTSSSDDPDEGLRLPVVEALGRIGPAAAPAVPRLLALIDGDSFRRTWAVADALGGIGPAAVAAVPALLDLLAQKSPPGQEGSIVPTVRRHAALALGRVTTSRERELVAARLRDVLADDGSRGWVRAEVAVALARVAPDGAAILDTLLPGLTSGDRSLAAGAARALGELPAIPDDAAAVLERALAHPDLGVRVAAAEALWKTRRRADLVVPSLVEVMRADRDAHFSYERCHAAEVLVSIGEAARPAVPAMARLLEDRLPEVQSWSAHLLGQLGPIAATAVPALERALAQPYAPRLTIARALEKIRIARE